MDLFSLTVIAGLFFGTVIADAAFFGNRVRVRMDVPSKLEQTGFTEATAERIFMAEAERIEQVSAVVPSQDVDVKSRQTLFTAIAKPLQLDGAVLALQRGVGIDVVSIDGSVIVKEPGPGLDMVMIVSTASQAATKFKLTQDNGDATALIEHAARLALDDITPYRVAISQFAQGLDGDAAAFAQARDTATRALNRPWQPTMAAQHVLLHNILALLSLIDGDLAAADAQYRQSELVPDQPAWAHSVTAFNQAFLAVATKQPAQARAYLGIVSQNDYYPYNVLPTVLQARWATLQGLVAWSGGDTAEAERLFRAASVKLPTDPEPHTYLAQLLAMKGDTVAAEQQRTEAAAVARFDRPIIGMAQADFWVDPVNGGLKRRR